jgi:hypothetical protein
MADDNPRDRLASLHAELIAAHSQDPEGRRALGEVLPDVHRMVQGEAQPGTAPDPTLPGRLEKVAVQFEAEHPKLAQSVRNLVDLLGEVGI